jgi:hypothetical protein
MTMPRIAVWALLLGVLASNTIRNAVIVWDDIGSTTFDGHRTGWGDELFGLVLIAGLATLTLLAGRKFYAAVRYR